MSKKPAQVFDVVTVVWGPEFRQLFLDVCVPNQLTPGNLDALPAGSRYRIFTSAADLDALAASPSLQQVRELLPVDIVVEPERATQAPDRFRRMTASHEQALRDAAQTGAALICLSPDLVMSAGALAAVVRRHRSGRRAVVCTGIRLNRGEFVAALRARGVHALPPRELASLALDHLHAFTLAHTIGAPRTACSPISVYWNVPGEGILVRSFFLHPLMIDPICDEEMPSTTIDAKYVARACPAYEDVHVVTDSDELSVFELSDAGAATIDTAPGAIPLWRLATMFTSRDAHQRRYWATPIRLHVREINSAWKTTEQESARLARRVMRLRLAVRWLGLGVQRFKRLEREGRWLKKRAGKAVSRFSPRRVQRFRLATARRIGRFNDHTIRAASLACRRAQRSAMLVTHSASRVLHKFRKRAGRTSRKLWRRARPA